MKQWQSLSLSVLSVALILGVLAHGRNGEQGSNTGNDVSKEALFLNSDCKETCKDIYRKRIKTCDTVYPPESRSDEHTACLKKAKSEFDDCLASCN